jgi:hypothetical protein
MQKKKEEKKESTMPVNDHDHGRMILKYRWMQ